MPLYTLPDRLIAPFNRQGVVLYNHHSMWTASRYMLAFTRPALVGTLAGERDLSYADVTETAGLASVVLFPPGPVISVALRDGREPFRCLMAFAPTSAITALLTRHAGEIPPARHRWRNLGPVDRVLPLARTMAEDVDRFGAGSPGLDAARFEELLLVLLAEGYEAELKAWAASAADPPAVRLTQVMEAHWAESLALQEYAFLCGMSLSAFKRTFVRNYGMSPGRWLLERRMIQAGHMLSDERLRPSQVWDSLGFSSQTAFTQAFRRQFGLTPGQYRSRRIRPESDNLRPFRNTTGTATPE